MKKLYCIILFLLTPLCFFAQSYNIDASKSDIKWIGKKPTGSHTGNIMIKDGYITLDKKGDISTGEFTLNMESINCTDLEGSKKEYFEEHLKNEDFFNTKRYPTSSFKITKVTNQKIYGLLTIKEISKEVDFNYTKINSLTYEGDLIIDRTHFDIKYKSKTIFPDIGDHFIYDKFTIKIKPIIFKENG